MRPDIEDETRLVAERFRVAAVPRILFVHDRPNALVFQTTGGAKTGHSGSQDNDVHHDVRTPACSSSAVEVDLLPPRARRDAGGCRPRRRRVLRGAALKQILVAFDLPICNGSDI